jgi:small subunit ribosomal protein S12e
LVKGLNEVVKSLDRKETLLCILSANCEDAKYKKLVTAMCKQNQIPMIEVEDRMKVGEWLGLCKYDKEGVARKVRGASSVAIKEYGEESEALSFVKNHIKDNQ